MAITGIGSSYNSYMYGSAHAAQKNEAGKVTEKKAQTQQAVYTKSENAKLTQNRTAADYYSYLSKNYDCVRNGNVAIAGSYIKQCADNPAKAKELEETLAFYKESCKSGYESAKANANALGARLVNYSESWSIDSTGNVTMQASATITSDAKGWKELQEEQEERIKEKKEKEKQAEKLSSVSSHSMINDFEKMLSEKANTFDRHANQMAAAYSSMKNTIEEKYANPNREQEYYVADDGSIQELTKEKEMEMLDQAYENHSRFMAANVEIWANLQNFKTQIAYQSNAQLSEQKKADADKSVDVRKEAYQAFMSAISSENIGLLAGADGDLQNLNLNLGISDSARRELNSIWSYYADRR